MLGTWAALRWLGWLAWPLGLLLLLVGAAWLLQRRMIYLPLDHVVPPAERVLPAAREVLLRTDDNLSLGAWLVPARSGEPRAKVLVFNGNAGHRAYRAPLAAALADRGFAVLLFDYRGYGGNPGGPSEQGLGVDARAARDYLESSAAGGPSPIVLFGESLGAALALAQAVERPPLALILRSPFTSLVDVGRLHYPFLPVSTLLADRYPSLERIGRLRCPLLVLAGERDAIVPPAQSRRLFEAAPSEPKRFVLLRGAGHNDYELLAGETLLDEVERFIEEALRGLAASDGGEFHR